MAYRLSRSGGIGSDAAARALCLSRHIACRWNGGLAGHCCTGRAIPEGIAGSKLEVIEGQRHLSDAEVSDAFNAILCDRLDQIVDQA